MLALAEWHSLNAEACEESLALACAIAPVAIARGRETARESYDFDDMVYLPAVEPHIAPPRASDWVLVDECQDLNAAQYAVISQALKPGGRFLFVGDRHQAIYGFAGAETGMFRRIARELNVHTLPLNICYRCPRSHVALAQKIVPDIESSPNAEQGLVGRIKYADLLEELRDDGGGALVLCRANAPLFKLALELITRNVSVRLRGNMVVDGLVNLFRRATHRRAAVLSTDEQISAVELYCFKRAAETKLKERPYHAWLDKAECLTHIILAARGGDVERFISLVSRSSNDERAVSLQTVHGAKGSESDRVFLLKPELMPLESVVEYGKSWEIAQEWNIKYVALTRSKRELFFVESEPREKKHSDIESPSRCHFESRFRDFMWEREVEARSKNEATADEENESVRAFSCA